MTSELDNFNHLLVKQTGLTESFVSPQKARDGLPPSRNRYPHASDLQRKLDSVLQIRENMLVENPDSKGFYLEFELKASSGVSNAISSLENRQGVPIELRAVKDISEELVSATVFIPESRKQHFNKKVEEYKTENTLKTGKPKNEKLIARIEDVKYGGVESLFIDDSTQLPTAEQKIWWEVWLVKDSSDDFERVIKTLAVISSPDRLSFCENEIILINASMKQMEKIVYLSEHIVELRLYKESPYTFMDMDSKGQMEFNNDLTDRFNKSNENNVYVCILDTGITQIHPLLSGFLNIEHCNSAIGTLTGGAIDRRGHGSNMAGLALFGDLTPVLESDDKLDIKYALESSKILHDTDTERPTPPRLYGAVSTEAVHRAEIANANANRVVCLAVTDRGVETNGKPTTWSAAIDQLAFEDDETHRLVIISAGNININRCFEYPNVNDLYGVESPAQAWNALTIGAISLKSIIIDQTFDNWQALAPVGSLCPTSRTSISWDDKWPIKPDVVFQGGNIAISQEGTLVDTIDDLSLLTTHHIPQNRPFHTIGDTSAATALASRFAAQIMDRYPEYWPETVRGLIVHSAEWNSKMQKSVANTEIRQFVKSQKRELLRRFGYGYPNLKNALNSAENDLTLIIQDSLQPYVKRGSVSSNELKLHKFPWPVELLEAIGDANVIMRVTLSYFVQPNPPSKSGKVTKYPYPSHGLRFAVKNVLQTDEQFRKRINAAARAHKDDVDDSDLDKWLLASFRKGSVFSDIWEGTAAELIAKDSIAVYPTGGWWKSRQHENQYHRNARYSLTVSIEIPDVDIDIYTPIKQALEVETQIIV